MKTLIIGASGKIGKYLVKYKRKDYIYTYNKKKIKHGIKFNLSKDNIETILKNFSVTKVVLLAAISDPDECFKNKKKSKLINITKTKKIIDILVKQNIYFIFFSSEFIFCGKKSNYNETSNVTPNNLYGKQKYFIEKYIKKKTKNFAILRVSKTYGDDLNDKTLITNFLNDLKKRKRNFKIASDQRFNPLYIMDLEKIISLFLKKRIKGIFNVGGPEQLSRYQCFKKMKNQFSAEKRKKIYLEKTNLKNFKLIEKRPLDVTFNISKIKNVINFRLQKIEEVTKKILKAQNLNEKLFNRR